jgi:type II secretory pathway pseudopilin PulG
MTSRLSGRGRAGEGFTLIEALVAFTILAVVMVSIQRAVVVALASTSRAETRVAAEMVARTLIWGPLGRGPNATTPKHGTMNGLGWKVHFEPVDQAFPAALGTNANAPAWMPVRMVAEISAERSGRPGLIVKAIRLVQVASP